MTVDWSDVLSRRAVLVTGKGGVGKTTIVATLARVAAARGMRVLCAEVSNGAEGVSPLARAFGREGSSADAAVAVDEGISTIVLTPTAGHRQFLRDTVKVGVLAELAMKSKAISGFLRAAPTFSEMGILYRFLDLLRPHPRNAHDILIVDLPATGHALAFAQFPAALLRIVPDGPVGSAIREGLALIHDPARTTALVVTLTESLPVSESIELTRGLIASNIPVSALVLNRVCPDPFRGAERAEADRLVALHSPIFGARTLRRIDSARGAVRRLTAELDRPLFVVEESSEEGPRVPVALAARMSPAGRSVEARVT